MFSSPGKRGDDMPLPAGVASSDDHMHNMQLPNDCIGEVLSYTTDSSVASKLTCLSKSVRRFLCHQKLPAIKRLFSHVIFPLVQKPIRKTSPQLHVLSLHVKTNALFMELVPTSKEFFRIFPNCQRLVLENGGVDPEPALDGFLRHIRGSLRELDLRNVVCVSDKAFAGPIGKVLTSLKMDNSHKTRGLLTDASLRGLQELRELHIICAGKFTDAGLQCLKKVRKLVLKGTTRLTNDAFKSFASVLEKLELVDVIWSSHEVPFLKSMGNLRTLRIDKCGPPDPWMGGISNASVIEALGGRELERLLVVDRPMQFMGKMIAEPEPREDLLSLVALLSEADFKQVLPEPEPEEPKDSALGEF